LRTFILFIISYFTLISAISVTENSTNVPSLSTTVIKKYTLAQKIQKLQPNINPILASEYSSLIKTYCITIDEDIVISIFMAESSFNPLAESSSNDFGIAQINLTTWGKELKTSRSELLNPILGISHSCQILKKLKKQHKGENYWWRHYHNRKKHINIKYIQRVTNIMNLLK